VECIWDLLNKQYRTITNGKLTATIYNDKSMVKTISTHFYPSEEINLLPANSTATNISLKPRLSEDDANILANLSLIGLKTIASAFGESTGGTKSDIARRIARLPHNEVSINTTELEVTGETITDFKNRISNLKKEHLVKMCKSFSITAGGTKKQLINSLMKQKTNTNKIDELKAKMKVLLQPTAQANEEDLPPIIEHYKNTFNSVDKFDQLLGHIKWRYRTEKPEFVWFINCVKFAVLNAWVIYLNHNNIKSLTEDEISLKEFICKLSNELMDV